MVEYFNLSKFSDIDGYMGFTATLSELTHNMWGIAILVVIFLIPVIIRVNKGEDINLSIHISALFTTLIAILFYITHIVTYSMCVWIPAMIYVITLIVRWYNR